MTRIKIVLPACAALLAGCQPPTGPDVTQVIAPSVITTLPGPAPDDTQDQCWQFMPTPATTTVVKENVKVSDATFDEDGREITPAIYSDDPVEIEVAGIGQHFARLCDDQITPALVETLQRALQARGAYQGEVTGVMDDATRAATQRYQQGQGLDSDVLSLAAARQLGLVAVDIPAPEPVPEPDIEPDIEPEPDVDPDAGVETETGIDPEADAGPEPETPAEE